MTSVDCDSPNELSVSQGAASQENLFLSKTDRFFTAWKSKLAVELVDELVLFLTLNNTVIEVVKCILIILAFFNTLFGCFLVFKVAFSVQILGLDIANTVRFRAINENEIAWEVLIFFNLDDLAHPQLLPPEHSEHPLDVAMSHDGVRCSHPLKVLSPIRHVSLNIFEQVLEHRDSDDEGERHGDNGLTARV